MIKTVIFDLDGTVLENSEIYNYAFKRVLVSLGAKVEADYSHEGGIGVINNWKHLIIKYKLDTKKTLEELAVATQEQYLLQLDEIKLKDGFLEFADKLKESEICIALATTNNWNVVNKILEKFNLSDYFDVITTNEEVKNSKPDPEIFLKTAEKMNTEPEMCIVFEDAISGVMAAKSAGMKVVGVATGAVQKEILKVADRIIDDFYDVTPEILNNLSE